MAGFKFGWKRKAGGKVNKSSQLFPEHPDGEGEDDESQNEVDWLTAAPDPKRRIISLEDSITKSKRLKHEGSVLAESERFWEAIKKWDEALQLTPNDERIIEMKAQALMSLHEVFPALQTAQRVVELAPTWWVAHQTLGRAHVNMGEVTLALKSFSRAIRLNPGESELWIEDLMWCKSLLERKKLAKAHDVSTTPASTVTVSELNADSGLSENENSDYSNKALTEYSSDNVHNREIHRIPKNYVQMRDPI